MTVSQTEQEVSLPGYQLVPAHQDFLGFRSKSPGSWVTGSQTPQPQGRVVTLLQTLRLQKDSKKILGTTLSNQLENVDIMDQFLEKCC